MNAQIDIRAILKTIQVPTIVIHRSGDRCLLVEEGRYLAEQIPGAKFVELPGDDHLPFVGDQHLILDEIEEFLTGVRHQPGMHRVLATVLYATAWVDPTESAEPKSPPSAVSLHRAHVVREIELFRGRTIPTADHTTIATFDGPARAIRAAIAIRDTAQRLGLQLKIGVHTGECDVRGDQVEGMAFDLAEGIAAVADVGSVMVSSTVRDLVAGSGIRFREAAATILPDELGDWHLYSVERSVT
jgi:class 3 adenylate cyclase